MRHASEFSCGAEFLIAMRCILNHSHGNLLTFSDTLWCHRMPLQASA